jgi:hypothetical protein
MSIVKVHGGTAAPPAHGWCSQTHRCLQTGVGQARTLAVLVLEHRHRVGDSHASPLARAVALSQ